MTVRRACCTLWLGAALAAPLAGAAELDAAQAHQRLAVMGVDKSIERLVQFAGQGDMPVVTLLLKAGVPAQGAEPMLGATPMHTAAAQGHVPVLRALLAQGAAADMPDLRGVTPLINAAYYGQLEAARLLVERGADVNATNADGTTVLMSSVYGGQDAVVRLLLARGADPRRGNAMGQTAIEIAERAGRATMAAAMRQGRRP